jgi:hypothetical protein
MITYRLCVVQTDGNSRDGCSILRVSGDGLGLRAANPFLIGVILDESNIASVMLEVKGENSSLSDVP